MNAPCYLMHCHSINWRNVSKSHTMLHILPTNDEMSIEIPAYLHYTPTCLNVNLNNPPFEAHLSCHHHLYIFSRLLYHVCLSSTSFSSYSGGGSSGSSNSNRGAFAFYRTSQFQGLLVSRIWCQRQYFVLFAHTETQTRNSWKCKCKPGCIRHCACVRFHIINIVHVVDDVGHL